MERGKPRSRSSTQCRLPSLLFFNDTATTEIYTLSLHDALPIWIGGSRIAAPCPRSARKRRRRIGGAEGSIGDKHPKAIQARATAVRSVPDHDRVDHRGAAQIHLPPGVRIEIGGGDGAIGKVPVGTAVHGGGGIRRRISRKGAALSGRFPEGEVGAAAGAPR